MDFCYLTAAVRFVLEDQAASLGVFKVVPAFDKSGIPHAGAAEMLISYSAKALSGILPSVVRT